MSELEEYLLVLDNPKYLKEFYEMKFRATDYALIVEQFQKMLGVYTTTEAITKLAALIDKHLCSCPAVADLEIMGINPDCSLHGHLAAQQSFAADGLESGPKCYCPADGLYPGCPVHGNHRR